MPEELDNVQEFGATQTVQAVTRAYVRLRDSGTPLGVAARWMECGLSAVKQLTRPAVDVVRSAKLLSAVDAMAVKYLNVGGVVASKSSEYLDGARRSVSGRVRRYCISVLRSRVGRAATAALDWCVAVCEAAVDALEIEQTPASEQNEKVAGADVCRGVSIRIKSAGPRLVIWVATPLKLLVQLLRSGRHQLKEYVFQYHRSPSKRAAIRRRNRVTPKKRLASPPYNSFIWLSLYLPNKLINFVRVYVSTSPTKPVFKSYLTSPSKQDGNPAMEPLLSDGDHDKKRKFDDITEESDNDSDVSSAFDIDKYVDVDSVDDSDYDPAGIQPSSTDSMEFESDGPDAESDHAELEVPPADWSTERRTESEKNGKTDRKGTPQKAKNFTKAVAHNKPPGGAVIIPNGVGVQLKAKPITTQPVTPSVNNVSSVAGKPVAPMSKDENSVPRAPAAPGAPAANDAKSVPGKSSAPSVKDEKSMDGKPPAASSNSAK